VLLPVIARYRGLKVPVYFRGDAAFAAPKLMKVLEAEGYWYAIRLKANAVLERNIAHLLRRPVGRPEGAEGLLSCLRGRPPSQPGPPSRALGLGRCGRVIAQAGGASTGFGGSGGTRHARSRDVACRAASS
jgi:hypothetical protein